MINPIV